MTRWNLRALISAIGCATATALTPMSNGCASRKPEVVWSPPPRASWADLSSDPVPAVKDSYLLLTAGSTTGLFPASMAVTRVSVTDPTSPSEGRALKLVRDPRNEFLQWNKAFDDLMAVSEVFPVSQRDLGGWAPQASQINAAMRALSARLGLVYAVNEVAPDETEMFGVLYDTQTSSPIAALHASAKSILPPPSCNREPEELDPWVSDSRALARRRFEQLAHACLHELITADQPADPQPDERWIPVKPARDVEWPPRERGTN